MVEAGTFRSDLFHRLNVIQVRLLPLRERGEDFAELILEFARRHAKLHQGITSLDQELLQHLRCCPFEGNVRELENAVQRMLFNKGEGHSLSRADWLHQQESSTTSTGRTDHENAFLQAADLLWAAMLQQSVPFSEMMRRIESELLQKALQVEGKTRREIADMLHTSERTLYHKMSARRSATPGRSAAG